MATQDSTGDTPFISTDASALTDMLDDLDRQTANVTDPDVVAKARESLEETFQGLQLTPDEERALGDELRQLRALTDKLDQNTIEIAAFGMVSRGKSSVLNALLGQEVFKVGTTHGTTIQRSQQRWEQATLDRPGLEGAKLVLVDTPGIDEVGGEMRESLAREVARHADLILFIVSSDMQRVEIESLSKLREAQKPIILVFNQIDRYPDTDRDQIYAKIKDERVRSLIRPDDVVMTAARPDPFRVKIQLPDGTTTIQWERPAPVIEPLKLRILDVLEREGKALVALNTLLLAGDLHEEIVAHKIRIRDDAANRMIWNFALAKGAAVALNPIPVADMAGGLAVDVGMIVALSKVYGIPLTRRTASGLVKDMMVALGTLGVVEVATRLLASGFKSSLAGLSVLTGGLAVPLTALGYGAIGLAQGGAAATTSYVLGHGAKVYLQQGCQWGPRGIKTVVHQILAEAKADSVIERLRDDLKRRVMG
jgi:small GTP-binding protein